jgi:ketosteroid isomerase-like protein
MNDADLIHALNDAVGRNDLHTFVEGMRSDAVWEHNPGTGSPEEGVYKGREEIGALFSRVLEGWEYLRPVATEIDEIEPGTYRVRGELHCMVKGTETEIVEHYEQRLEIRDGLMGRMRMVIGTTAYG